MVLPLTLTLLSDAVPAERRGLALGFWVGDQRAGRGHRAAGRRGGGEGISWQWIFWLNVPIGLAVLPLAATGSREPRPRRSLDIPGLALVSGGLFGIVWGLVRGNALRLDRSPDPGRLVGAGAVLVAGFVAWELRTPRPDAADAAFPQPRLRARRTQRRC